MRLLCGWARGLRHSTLRRRRAAQLMWTDMECCPCQRRFAIIRVFFNHPGTRQLRDFGSYSVLEARVAGGRDWSGSLSACSHLHYTVSSDRRGVTIYLAYRLVSSRHVICVCLVHPPAPQGPPQTLACSKHGPYPGLLCCDFPYIEAVY